MASVKVTLGALLLATTSALAQSPKQLWKQIEADNGAIYAIDLNSISHHSNGLAHSQSFASSNAIRVR